MALIKIIFSLSAVALVSCVTTFIFNLCVHAKTSLFLLRGEVGRVLNSEAARSKKRIFNPQTTTTTTLNYFPTHRQHRVHPATPQHSQNMLLSVLTVTPSTTPPSISPPATQPNSPRKHATGSKQGTNRSPPVLTGGTGGGEGKRGGDTSNHKANKKRER